VDSDRAFEFERLRRAIWYFTQEIPLTPIYELPHSSPIAVNLVKSLHCGIPPNFGDIVDTVVIRFL
jgi:hypothetical protein